MLPLFATSGQFLGDLKASPSSPPSQPLGNFSGTFAELVRNPSPTPAGILRKAWSKFLATLEQLFCSPGAAPPLSPFLPNSCPAVWKNWVAAMETGKMERRRSRTRSYYKVTAHYNGFRVADTRRRTKLRLKRRRLISSREDEGGRGEGREGSCAMFGKLVESLVESPWLGETETPTKKEESLGTLSPIITGICLNDFCLIIPAVSQSHAT